MQACFQHTSTKYVPAVPEEFTIINGSRAAINETITTTIGNVLTTTMKMVTDANSNGSAEETTIKWVRTYPMNDGVNVLGNILYVCVWGVVLCFASLFVFLFFFCMSGLFLCCLLIRYIPITYLSMSYNFIKYLQYHQKCIII